MSRKQKFGKYQCLLVPRYSLDSSSAGSTVMPRWNECKTLLARSRALAMALRSILNVGQVKNKKSLWSENNSRINQPIIRIQTLGRL